MTAEERAVLVAILESDAPTIRDLAAVIDRPISYAHRLVLRLAAAGLVVRGERGSRGTLRAAHGVLLIDGHPFRSSPVREVA